MTRDVLYPSTENPAAAFFTAQRANADRAELIKLAIKALKYAEKNKSKTKSEFCFSQSLSKLAKIYYNNGGLEVESIVDAAPNYMLLYALESVLPPDLTSEENLAEDTTKRSWCRII